MGINLDICADVLILFTRSLTAECGTKYLSIVPVMSSARHFGNSVAHRIFRDRLGETLVRPSAPRRLRYVA
jgi:hypothetical protein